MEQMSKPTLCDRIWANRLYEHKLEQKSAGALYSLNTTHKNIATWQSSGQGGRHLESAWPLTYSAQLGQTARRVGENAASK